MSSGPPGEAAGDGSSRTVWCIMTTPATHGRNDTLAAFALPFVRPGGEDIVVIPDDRATLEFAEFCREMLGFQRDQLVCLASQHGPYSEASQFKREDVDAISEALAKCEQPARPIKVVSVASSSHFARTLRNLNVTVTVIGETAKDIDTFSHTPVLFRRVKQVDKVPAMVEDLDLGVPVCKGLLCEDTDDLLVAYRHLGLTEATLRPVINSHRAGEGLAVVSSPDELRQYDFPYGPVVLAETVAFDRSPHGTDVSVAYLFEGAQPVGSVQQVSVGPAFFGCRSLEVPAAFEQQAQEVSSKLVGALKPKGVTSVVFGMVDSKPVLVSVHTDAAGMEYFATLFMERHFPRRKVPFFTWFVQPRSCRVDIWTAWARMVEAGIAMNPRTDRKGVFPLVLLKDTMAVLIAVGDSEEEIMAMRDQADQCLYEEVEEMPLVLASWSESNRRIWCNGARPEYKRMTQRYNMCCRNLALVRKGKDFIVLPGQFEPLREFAEFIREVLELDEEQIIWTSGDNYLLDDDIATESNVVGRIKSVVVSNPSDTFTLVPYAVTSHFERWANQLSELGVCVFGETTEWISKYGHKGMLHRCPSRPSEPSVLEQLGVSVAVPRGWYCCDHDEIMQAYAMMRAKGIERVVIKPVFGAAGEGIVFPSEANAEEEVANYNFPMGPVNLEEFLILDCADDGVVLSPAVHYMEKSLTGKGMVDQIMVGTGYAGWRRSQAPKSLQAAAQIAAESLIKRIAPRGPGGFDFLSVAGKPYLTDINTGRFNGAHSPKLFVDIHAPGQAFYCWKAKPLPDADIWRFWQLLSDRGVAFDKNRKGGPGGVFPLTFMRGLSGMYISVARTDEEAFEFSKVARECLPLASPTGVPAGVPRRIRGQLSVFKRADILRRKWRRVWVQSPLPELLRNRTDPFVSSLPLYAASVLRRSLDLVVLPATEAAVELWAFLRAVLDLDPDQALFVPVASAAQRRTLDALLAESPDFPALLRDHLSALQDRVARSPLLAAASALAAAASGMQGAASPPMDFSLARAMSPGPGHPGHVDSSMPLEVLGASIARGASPMLDGLPLPPLFPAGDPSHPPQPHHDHPSPHPSRDAWPGRSDSETSSRRTSLERGAKRKAQRKASQDGSESKGPGASLSLFTLVPSSTGHSFQAWAGPLIQEGVRVFGDGDDFLRRFGNREHLHRDIDKPDTPSLLEEMRVKVTTLPGYVCRSRQGLLAAWDALGRRPAVLRTCRHLVHPWERAVVITQETQLRLYDFPRGAVLLEDVSSMGAGTGGAGLGRAVAAVPCLGPEVLGTGVMDLLMVGTQLTGLRSSTRPTETQEAFLAAAKRFLAAAKPMGPTTLCFTEGAEGSPPVLVDVRAGFFGREHFLSLFLEEHAPPDAHFLAFQAPVPPELDLWTLWLRLGEAGLCLSPSGGQRTGLFPLVYERGASSLLVAVGETPEEAQEVRDRGMEILKRRVEGGPLPRAHWAGPKVRRVLAPGPGAPMEQHCAALAMVRRGKDVCLLTGEAGALGEFRQMVAEALGLTGAEVATMAEASGTGAAEDEWAAAGVALKGAILSCDPEPGERFTLVTGLAPPDALANNLGELPVGLFAEDPSFSQNFCGKRLLYRGVSGTDGRPAPVEEIGAQQGMRIRTARGFAVRNQEELQAAYKQLGGGVCVIRPLGQMEMGKPLILVDSAEQLTLVDGAAYDWELAVEEHLALDRTKSGTSRSFLIPFHGLTVRRDDAQDKVTIGTAVVGLRPSAASKKLLDEAARVAQAVVAHTRPATVGAVHFHAMDNHAVLAGLTVGPFDPYHAGLVFADVFAPGSRTTLWRFSAPADLPASQFYAALSAKGLALSPGQTTRGVFPIAYARGGLGIMVAVAPSPLDAALLQERSAMAIERLGKGLDLDVVPPPAPARRSAVEGMMLIRGADAVFAPAAVPQRNVLVAGGKILGLLDDEQASIFAAVPDVAQIDASGFVLAPGLVDMHVHVQGGGGEAGPETRTPDAQLSALISAGITTVVGITGTDGVTRSMEGLLAKCRGLTNEGITAYMWAGSYAVPPPTITGSILKDITCVEQVLGVGEIAISDHRGSQPSRQDLVKVASECRVGGMLSGKCGIVHVHVGPGSECLAPLFDVVNNSEIPISQFVPTHMDRSEALIADGARWLSEGGRLDITCRSVKCRIALKDYDAKGLLADNVSVSSDAYGSLPVFDGEGNLIRYKSADAQAQLRLLRQMYFTEGWPLEKILPLMTSIPAGILKLQHKGRIEPGCDADILMLSATSLKLKRVIAKGKLMKAEGWVAGGVFEKGPGIRPYVPL